MFHDFLIKFPFIELNELIIPNQKKNLGLRIITLNRLKSFKSIAGLLLSDFVIVRL